jgi:hypothetical protein
MRALRVRHPRCVQTSGQRRLLSAGAVAVRAPWPAAGPTLAFLQLLLGPANATFSGRLLLGIFDPADELVAAQRRDVLPGIECRGVGNQGLAQVSWKLVHHPTGHSRAAHKVTVANLHRSKGVRKAHVPSTIALQGRTHANASVRVALRRPPPCLLVAEPVSGPRRRRLWITPSRCLGVRSPLERTTRIGVHSDRESRSVQALRVDPRSDHLKDRQDRCRRACLAPGAVRLPRQRPTASPGTQRDVDRELELRNR